MNRIDIEGLADGDDEIGVAGGEQVFGGVGKLRPLQDSDPLRITDVVVRETHRLPEVIRLHQEARGIKHPVAVQVHVEPEFVGEHRELVGDDEHRRAGVVVKVGEVLQEVVGTEPGAGFGPFVINICKV